VLKPLQHAPIVLDATVEAVTRTLKEFDAEAPRA
jgi:hypothetical protein